MKIGILGSGDVGKALSEGLTRIGHEVKIGTREPSKLKLELDETGNKASVGNLDETAKFGEIIFICTKWTGTENAIRLASIENFTGKIVVDVTNPLDSSTRPPKMISSPGNSAGEKIQIWLPKSKVVKAFNNIGNPIMINPKRNDGDPSFFIVGNDEGKKVVSDIAKDLGWKEIIDLGDISNSYLLEALAMIWIVYGFMNNNWTQAFKLLKS